MNRILLVLVALITMGTAAPAQPFNTLIASGPVYGGVAQTQVRCFIFNGGVNPITLTNARIIEETGVSLTLTSNTCTGTLPAAGICSWRVTTILNNRAHACTILVNSVLPNAPYIRGELDIRTPLQVILANEQLR
jgi:hypothetical protein